MRNFQIEFLSLLALIVSTAAFANEVGNFPQVKKITNGMPKDAVALIERIAECNHWSGEEPYDQERAEQIRKAVKKSRCGSLDSVEQTIEQKYKRNKKVLEAIKKATELMM